MAQRTLDILRAPEKPSVAGVQQPVRCGKCGVSVPTVRKTLFTVIVDETRKILSKTLVGPVLAYRCSRCGRQAVIGG